MFVDPLPTEQRSCWAWMLLVLTPLSLTLTVATLVGATEQAATKELRPGESTGGDPNSPLVSQRQTENQRKNQATAVSTELRVAPLDHVEYPADRPAWIDVISDMNGDTHTWVVVSTPSESLQESLESLQMLQSIAIDLYANKLIQQAGHHDSLTLDESWMTEHLERLVARTYQGTLIQGDAEYFEHAVELHFTPEIQTQIWHQWKNQEVGRRLGLVGFLTVIGTVLTGCGAAAMGILARRVERHGQGVRQGAGR